MSYTPSDTPFVLNRVLQAVDSIISKALVQEGIVYGTYFHQVLLPRAFDPSCSLTFDRLDLSFPTEAAQQRFLRASESELCLDASSRYQLVAHGHPLLTVYLTVGYQCPVEGAAYRGSLDITDPLLINLTKREGQLIATYEPQVEELYRDWLSAGWRLHCFNGLILEPTTLSLPDWINRIQFVMLIDNLQTIPEVQRLIKLVQRQVLPPEVSSVVAELTIPNLAAQVAHLRSLWPDPVREDILAALESVPSFTGLELIQWQLTHAPSFSCLHPLSQSAFQTVQVASATITESSCGTHIANLRRTLHNLQTGDRDCCLNSKEISNFIDWLQPLLHSVISYQQQYLRRELQRLRFPRLQRRSPEEADQLLEQIVNAGFAVESGMIERLQIVKLSQITAPEYQNVLNRLLMLIEEWQALEQEVGDDVQVPSAANSSDYYLQLLELGLQRLKVGQRQIGQELIQKGFEGLRQGTYRRREMVSAPRILDDFCELID